MAVSTENAKIRASEAHGIQVPPEFKEKGVIYVIVCFHHHPDILSLNTKLYAINRRKPLSLNGSQVRAHILRSSKYVLNYIFRV